MHKYTYCLDGIKHTIKSQEPIQTADGVITISREQNKIASQLKQLLQEWIRLADKHNIPWFCNGGTLLGAIRDKGLIHYDNDLDLVVFLKDYYKIKNMTCGQNFEIDSCEQGFQLHFKDKMFPFIDLWVEAPNPNDPKQIIIACPILDDGTPTYGANFLCPNDNFNIKDVTTFVKVPFEDLIVNVPKNSEQYLRKMYGDDCLTRYVIYTHTNNHSLYDIVPPPKIRMKLFNTLLKLENQPTIASTITGLGGTLIMNELSTSGKDKNKRHMQIIQRHIGERYFGMKPPFGV